MELNYDEIEMYWYERQIAQMSYLTKELWVIFFFGILLFLFLILPKVIVYLGECIWSLCKKITKLTKKKNKHE